MYQAQERNKRYWSYFKGVFQNELSEDSESGSQPSWIKTPLYAHQKSLMAAAPGQR